MEQKISQEQYVTGLKVNNSLKPGNLDEFVPMKGRQIRLYNCGPTVYDASHMGHARTYISVDMIKRILTKYFGYDVFFAMNITDIDDKIIIRSNEKGEEFTSFARKWENDFWDDMNALGVALPDVLVRVSEHIPEITDFIQKIIDNGYAYESNGSVYFNVPKFMESPNHFYAKLDPKKVRGDDSEREPEENNPDKKSAKDFALWKASKPGEPKWKSQWSEGRPGWHIECSAMADSVLGYPIDVHMGGIDLKFPHHDNEIAQTEAYYNKPSREENEWVKYFIHAGHLNIDGLKMSKSLKNFITIKNLLKHFTPRQIRLVFLLHQYDTVMNYVPHVEKDGKLIDSKSMQEAQSKEKVYLNFFRTIIAVLRQSDIKSEQKWNKIEFSLNETLMEVKQNIHQHLKNNFDTKSVIEELDRLLSETNVYMQSKNVKKPLLTKIYDYAVFIFDVVGLDFQDKSSKGQKEEQFLTEIGQLSSFRDKVREFARKDKQFDQIVTTAQEFQEIAKNAQSEVKQIFIDYVNNILLAAQEKDFKKIMNLSDEIRDEQLPHLGIKIDDRNDEPSLWKQEDKEVILKELEEKKQKKLKAEQEKAKKKEEQLRKQKEEEEKMKIDPSEMFLKDEKYSQFDETGLPTHDKEGKELSKKQKAYVKKEYEKQAKRFQQYKDSQNK